jgi:hypothetical protein
MKNFAIVLGLLASVSSFAGVTYSNTADVSAAASHFKIWRAKGFNLATKTEIREIPGCNPNGEQYPCTEEVAIERTKVLAVDVEYSDPQLMSDGNNKQFVSFVLPASDIGKELELTVKKVQRTIQVVDVRNSKICRELESGDIEPGCVEHLVYKPAQTTVKEVTVTLK